MTNHVTTSLPLQNDRGFSPRLAGDYAQGIEASRVVDYLLAWDQFNGWWTRALWQPENTPWAEVIPDNDSCPDAFLIAAFAAAATTKLGVSVSTDAIRRGPGELMQTMLTLAGATDGRAALMIGAGELRQAKPFGWKRSEGMAKLEDLLKIFNLFWDTDGPIDFDGNIWKLRNAWLGSTRPYKPIILALGGGPQLRDLAVNHADGWSTAAPAVYPTPERFADEVATIKQKLERAGKDPDAFIFSVWFTAFITESDDDIELAVQSPLLRWLAALSGRLNQADWEAEGVEPIFPRDWHYALKFNPLEVTAEQAAQIAAQVDRKMLEKSYVMGSTKEVAATIQQYVEAGANWVLLADTAPILRPISEAQAGLGHSIEVCRILKG